MFKKSEPPVIGKPYPVVCGHGYRVFDGKAWHDCTKYGERKDNDHN